MIAMEQKNQERKILNFWYSKKQEESQKQDMYYFKAINGIQYTEACEVDHEPPGDFDDYELVYTGPFIDAELRSETQSVTIRDSGLLPSVFLDGIREWMKEDKTPSAPQNEPNL